jgi:hypothetical protein
MRKMILTVLFPLLCLTASPQDDGSGPSRLKVYIDCSDTWCDMDFIRTEINIVDFLLDRQAADLHILVTEQSTGGGGSQYQFILFGQHSFHQMSDTIRFNVDPNATDFEEREIFIKYLKIGLTPYVAKTSLVKNMMIQMKTTESMKPQEKDSSSALKDPWNYWVFRVGVHGYVDADANYNSSRMGASIYVTRITDKIKIGFDLNGGKRNDSYEIENANGSKDKIVNRNDDYQFQQYIVKSLSNHWSYGYEVVFSRSTFSNNKHSALFNTGVEFNIFPYKQVNTRLFTLAYTFDVRRNAYFDSTLYDKKKETLFGQGLEAKLRVNQKWGTIRFGTEYHNYLHNWKYLNLGANAEIELRITGGLSLSFYTSAQLIRDQLFLPKEGATPQEVLTRRRQLASGYRLFSSFGLSYRFGSKLNNFVNPRFD